MEKGRIYVSELSSSKHVLNKYHFCRGNSNRRKTRFGVIRKGYGTYIYLNKELNVKEGDVVFIPENVFCYSKWHGNPEIEVIYISCFMHLEQMQYQPQILDCDAKDTHDLTEISDLLSLDFMGEWQAYSMFYKLLQRLFCKMVPSDIPHDKSLQSAIEFITDNWDKRFSVSDVAKKCCMSESALYHMFQKKLGQTPVSFLNSIRINKSIEFLENSNYSITTISHLVGFNSENHFRSVFFDITGTTPLKFRKKCK